MQESTTHSAVWEKFLKIALDSTEVPFVCCKFCRKVYTHDRTLGTSRFVPNCQPIKSKLWGYSIICCSLIRHQCGEEGEVGGRAGGLPRILVQELVLASTDLQLLYCNILYR